MLGFCNVPSKFWLLRSAKQDRVFIGCQEKLSFYGVPGKIGLLTFHASCYGNIPDE